MDAFLTTEALMIMVATSVAIAAIARLVPSWAASSTWARVAPLLPLLIASALVWLPGVGEGMAIGARVIWGVCLGGLSSTGYKAIRQTLLGQDARLRTWPPQSRPPSGGLPWKL